MEAADADPVKAWILEGEEALPALAVREFWRWKSLVFRNARNRAQNTRQSNPEWYS